MTPYQKFLNFPPIRFYLLAWKRFFDYQGISNRKEYWWAGLSSLIVNAVLFFLISLISFNLYDEIPIQSTIFLSAFTFITRLQIFSLGIRRLRDCGAIKNKTSDLFYYLISLLSFLRFPTTENIFLNLMKFGIGLILLYFYVQPTVNSSKESVNDGQ